jgi:sodium/proline symporter
MMLISFAAFLVVFIAVGVWASRRAHGTSEDYLLAGNDVAPWLTALSAVATNSSGYMFIGMIGFTYAVGLSSMWLMIGWIIGDYMASHFVHARLRHATESQGSLTFPELLASWHGTNFRVLRVIAALLTIIFLGTYAAAQLNAGSKALHVLLGWEYEYGAIMGAVMVVLYCSSGGLRASIWTDATQAIVMFVSMLLLCFVAVDAAGGVDAWYHALSAIPDGYMAVWPSHSGLSGVEHSGLFILGWLAAGFGVIGQPHIMVRFMAMDNVENMRKVRAYYYGWFAVFWVLTIIVGLAARLLIPTVENFDAELALPTLADQLLPEILVGLVLAGLFSATMSTADSQILSCSASLTRDFSGKKSAPLWVAKSATILVTILALVIAVSGSESVFTLVLVAWSALAAAFGPLLVVYALGGRPSQPAALSMMVLGVLVTLWWRNAGYGDLIFEAAPGMLAGFVPYLIWRAWRGKAGM